MSAGEWWTKADARRARLRAVMEDIGGACEFDPPCPHPVVDVVISLNPNMPPRNACAAHAMPMMDPARSHGPDLETFLLARLSEEILRDWAAAVAADIRAGRTPESAQRAIACVYADHPEYRSEWRP